MARLRVLHVVGRMSRGGVETWLMQVLRHVDPARVRMDFLVNAGAPGDFDEEIRGLGSTVIRGPSPAQPVRFARRLLGLVRERGGYDVVHSHVYLASGLVLAVARRAGIPVRIAHGHQTPVEAGTGLRRRAYVRLMKALIRAHATHGLAVSAPAAAAIFGARWRDDERWEVARCGLDFGAFRTGADRSAARADLGVPDDAVVLGHVGRFDPLKNHAFLLRIAAAAFRREPRARLSLVGDGALRSAVERDAARLGIRDRVAFAGVRPDVPRLLRAFDVFVMPSVHEGLPLVGLEAQAAGVPIVLSDTVTRELAVIPDLFTWRSLADPPEAWAEAVLAAARSPAPVADPVAALEASEFSLSRSLSGLLAVYSGGPP